MKQRAKVERETDAYALLRLENQLCFALYAASRALTKTYRDRLAPMGLTYPQFLVLLVLWEREGVIISEIGDKLMLDSGTLTPLVKRLERMGVVRRARGAQDEREVRVWLAPKGRELRDAALDARRYVGRRLAMTEREIHELRADLMAVLAHLDATTVEPADLEETTAPAF